MRYGYIPLCSAVALLNRFSCALNPLRECAELVTGVSPSWWSPLQICLRLWIKQQPPRKSITNHGTGTDLTSAPAKQTPATSLVFDQPTHQASHKRISPYAPYPNTKQSEIIPKLNPTNQFTRLPALVIHRDLIPTHVNSFQPNPTQSNHKKPHTCVCLFQVPTKIPTHQLSPSLTHPNTKHHPTPARTLTPRFPTQRQPIPTQHYNHQTKLLHNPKSNTAKPLRVLPTHNSPAIHEPLTTNPPT